ncbi:MAG: hypothetical protein U9Q81_05555, partial [Pseudomonadota bacterium]|nr:hypothetical protein [Pseudomonadota bacterium]
LAGFVTPGAPAGLGIREAVIVLLLEQLGLGDEALQIALVFRLATVGGDLLFLLMLAPLQWRRPVQGARSQKRTKQPH